MKITFNQISSSVKDVPSYIKTKLRRKNIFIVGLLLVVVLLVVFRGGKSVEGEAFVVESGTLSKTVPATGTVTSDVDLSLSFQISGRVASVNVESGEEVGRGEILASLENSEERAGLSRAEADLAAAESKLKVLETELQNAQKTLDATISVQDGLVESAYRKLLSSDLEAVPSAKDTDKTPPEVRGIYLGNVEGEYRVKVEFDSSSYTTNASFDYSGIEKSSDETKIYLGKTVPLGTEGLSLLFPEDFQLSGYDTDWIIKIPNTEGASYVTNYTAYEDALANRDLAIANAEALVLSKQAELASVASLGTTPEVLLARSEVARARAVLEDTYIRAPGNGTVTRVDIDTGDVVEAYKEVVDLKDLGELYVEAYVNESSIVGVRSGLPVEIVFDALGSDKVFWGEVSSVDLSPKSEDGVVNYKILVSLPEEGVEDLRTGYTATLEIQIFSLENVLSIPKKALSLKDGVFSVSKVKDEKIEEVVVTVGREGDGGFIVVENGLSVGDEILVD